MGNLILAGVALGLGCSLAAPAAEQRGNSELVAAVKSGDTASRILAIDALGDRGGEIDGAVEALIAVLRDESAMVRGHAAHALGQIGPAAKPAGATLVGLLKDDSPQVRRVAFRAYMKIRPGLRAAVPVLTELLADPDPAVRVQVLDALAEIGKPIVPLMIRGLRNDKHRYWASLVLADIGPDASEAVDALVEVVRNEERSEIRREAILALGAIGPASAPVVPALIEEVGKTGQDEGGVRGAAIYALGQIGPEANTATAALKKVVVSADYPPLEKALSLWAVVRINPDDEVLLRAAVLRLAGALRHEDAAVRVAAARALVDLRPGAEISLPAVKKALAGAEAGVVGNALDALAALGPQAVPLLVEALKTERLRPKVISIFRAMGPPAKEAVPALAELAAGAHPGARREALFALAAIGPEARTAVPAALKALGDADVNVRYAACYALGSIGPAAMPAKAELVETLAASDTFLALAGAWALARIHPDCTTTCRESVPLLIRGLEESEPMLRLEAAESLKCLGPLAKSAVPALSQALEDEDRAVREMAAEALKALGN